MIAAVLVFYAVLFVITGWAFILMHADANNMAGLLNKTRQDLANVRKELDDLRREFDELDEEVDFRFGELEKEN